MDNELNERLRRLLKCDGHQTISIHDLIDIETLGFPLDDDAEITNQIKMTITISDLAIDHPSFDISKYIGKKTNNTLRCLMKRRGWKSLSLRDYMFVSVSHKEDKTEVKIDFYISTT